MVELRGPWIIEGPGNGAGGRQQVCPAVEAETPDELGGRIHIRSARYLASSDGEILHLRCMPLPAIVTRFAMQLKRREEFHASYK